MWNPDNPTTIIYADASNYALGSALHQLDDQSQPYAVAFESRTLLDAETRYPTREKELLAIYHAFI